MIGRAGLAEGQSALTDRGAGDASAAARSRWLAERWRYTRNQNNQGPTSCRVGETMITNEFACLTLLSLSRSRYVHHPHPTFLCFKARPFRKLPQTLRRLAHGLPKRYEDDGALPRDRRLPADPGRDLNNILVTGKDVCQTHKKVVISFLDQIWQSWRDGEVGDEPHL